MTNKSYALVTAARNEDAYIETILKAVVAQTRTPKVWVIVSDGSTDRTDDIVQNYASQHDFIHLVHLHNKNSRGFSNQAIASNSGYATIRRMQFDFIGFLDADVSFAPEYYERLLASFHANPRLGVGGGQIIELHGDRYEPRPRNVSHEVAGAIQFLRRECYDAIGGLQPLRWGGHDTVANAMARRLGWEVQTFADLDVLHHRPTGTAGSTVTRARFRDGLQDYSIGYHFLYELGKCIRRITEPPYVSGSLVRFCGYLWPAVTRQKQMVSSDFVHYLRQEQLRRMMPLFARAGRDVCRKA
jgi:Glycosyl transferase family 2